MVLPVCLLKRPLGATAYRKNLHPQSVCHANYSNIAYTWSITETSAVLETPELLYIFHREICNIIAPLDWSMLFGCNNIHLIYFCSRFKSVMNMFELGNLHGRPSHICYACVICDGYMLESCSEYLFRTHSATSLVAW